MTKLTQLCTDTITVHYATLFIQFEDVRIRLGISWEPRLKLRISGGKVCHRYAETYQIGIEIVAQADEIGMIEEESYACCSCDEFQYRRKNCVNVSIICILVVHSRFVTLEVLFLR